MKIIRDGMLLLRDGVRPISDGVKLIIEGMLEGYRYSYSKLIVTKHR